MSTLEIRDLHVSVTTESGPKEILRGVDLTIRSGETHAIMGPNGSGKTILIGLLLSRTSPEEGSASLGAAVRVGEVDQARDLVDGPEVLRGVVDAAILGCATFPVVCFDVP